MEPVRLLRDYIRLDTRDGIGEQAGAEFLQRFFDCAGIETEMVCPAPKRCNLLARLPGKSREGAILLLNHIDVAEFVQSYWKESSPFSGDIKLGFLYGRGAYDMKSLGLTEALAMRNLKDHGIVPPSDILFLAEANEEGRQEWGSRWLLDHRPEWFKGVAVVLNEGGTNEMILRTVRFWGIETVQAGYGFAEFEAPSPEPLKELAKRWPKLQATAVEPLPDVVEGFGMLANHLGHPLTDPLRHLQRVIHDPAELAILPDRYGAFLEPRIFWTPQYPDRPSGPPSAFIAFAYISTPPGIAPDPYIAPLVQDARHAGIKVLDSGSTGATAPSPYRDASGQLVPFLRLIQRVTEARYPGVPFGPVPTFAGVTTSLQFRNRGIPAYGYSPTPFNITDSARRHGNDERIYLRDYVNGVDLYKELLLEFALPSQTLSLPQSRN